MELSLKRMSEPHLRFISPASAIYQGEGVCCTFPSTSFHCRLLSSQKIPFHSLSGHRLSGFTALGLGREIICRAFFLSHICNLDV